MSHPVSRWEKVIWIASWVAPLALWGVFIAFGLTVAWPQLRTDAKLASWLIGALALLAFVAHALVWHHGTTAVHFTPEERGALKQRLQKAGGHGHWRALMRKYDRHWQKGRSRSGARPRFD
jgi:hypothetical protein